MLFVRFCFIICFVVCIIVKWKKKVIEVIVKWNNSNIGYSYW